MVKDDLVRRDVRLRSIDALNGRSELATGQQHLHSQRQVIQTHRHLAYLLRRTRDDVGQQREWDRGDKEVPLVAPSISGPRDLPVRVDLNHPAVQLHRGDMRHEGPIDLLEPTSRRIAHVSVCL